MLVIFESSTCCNSIARKTPEVSVLEKVLACFLNRLCLILEIAWVMSEMEGRLFGSLCKHRCATSASCRTSSGLLSPKRFWSSISLQSGFPSPPKEALYRNILENIWFKRDNIIMQIYLRSKIQNYASPWEFSQNMFLFLYFSQIFFLNILNIQINRTIMPHPNTYPRSAPTWTIVSMQLDDFFFSSQFKHNVLFILNSVPVFLIFSFSSYLVMFFTYLMKVHSCNFSN